MSSVQQLAGRPIDSKPPPKEEHLGIQHALEHPPEVLFINRDPALSILSFSAHEDRDPTLNEKTAVSGSSFDREEESSPDLCMRFLICKHTRPDKVN